MKQDIEDEDYTLIEYLFKLFCRYWATIFSSITFFCSILYCIIYRNTDMLELAIFSAVVLLLSIAIRRACKIF